MILESLNWPAIRSSANLLVFLLRDQLSADLDLSTLSAAELKRGQQYRLPTKQRQFFFTRSIGREVLAKYLEVSPQNISWNASGPPAILVNGKSAGCAVSVSHSGNVSALAIAPAQWQIGVDIEMQPENFNWKALAAIALTPVEQEALQAEHAVHRPTLLLHSWTLKEAVLKCLRTMPAPEARAVRMIWEPDGAGFPREIHLDDSRINSSSGRKQDWRIARFQSELLTETASWAVPEGIFGQTRTSGAGSGALAIFRTAPASSLTQVDKSSRQPVMTEVANRLKFSRIRLMNCGVKRNSGILIDLLVATI